MNSLAAAAQLPPAARDDMLAVLDDPIEQQRFTRWSTGADGQREALSSFVLSGLHCAACTGIIESAWRGVDGVREVRVSAAAQRAQVRWDPQRCKVSGLVRVLRAAGYDAAPDDTVSARALRQRERRAALWRLFVAGFCAMQVMMFATPIYLAADGDLAPDLQRLLNWGAWLLSVPVLVFSAGPFFSAAWHGLKARRIVMDLPVALGLVVSFVASSGAAFDPGGVFGHEVYFDSLTMFVAFLLAARCLEMAARHRAAESLEQTLSRMPETALRVLDSGGVERVSVRRLQPGDTLRVALGEAFPADGWLLAGSTEADESLLSGESRAVRKRAGDALVGGSVNLAGPVEMRVSRVGADTRFEAIVAMMRDALTQRPAIAGPAEAWAGPFLWTVLLLAGGAAAVWSFIDPSRAVWVAVSVLIVTCPCALSLAAPSAMITAAATLARRGVMLQRLDALAALANMTRLYLDKTGTLTDTRPGWQRTVPATGNTLAAGEVRAAVALAAWSSHPLAAALSDDPAILAALGEGPEPVWQQVNEQPGAGISAVDGEGRTWRLGSRAWVEQGGGSCDHGCDRGHGDGDGDCEGDGSVGRAGSMRPEALHAASEAGGDATPMRSTVPDAADLGDTHASPQVWFGCEGRLHLHFDFDERLRPDAQASLAALRADGVELGLLSGDASGSAERLAARLGIDELMADARPEDKLRALAAAQARGEVVGMVGDGVNDAPVLARADVSFAMGQGALVARAHADAVIASDRLQDLVFARHLARRTLRVVRQNIAWAALYNAACIPLALAGWLPPWAAGIGMASSSLLVIGNALRLSR